MSYRYYDFILNYVKEEISDLSTRNMQFQSRLQFEFYKNNNFNNKFNRLMGMDPTEP